MRLIRLYNSSNSGDFMTEFYEDLRLKPKSQIGLVNASIGFSDDHIEVTNDNNTMTFSTQDDPAFIRTVNLTNGVYNTSSFIEMFNAKINSALDFDDGTTSDVGFIWKAIISKEKFLLQFNRTIALKPVLETVNIVLNNETIQRSTQTTNSWAAFCFTQIPFIESCGYAKARIAANPGIFAIGLSDVISTDYAQFDEASYNYCIYVRNDGGLKYSYAVNGVITDTNHAVANGDEAYIILDKGNVVFNTYTSASAKTTLNSGDTIPFDYSKNYNFGISIYNGNTLLSLARYTPTPFVSQTSEGVSATSEIDDTHNLHLTVPLDTNLGSGPNKTIANPTIVTIRFPEALKALLGYDDVTYSVRLKKGKFHAKEDFLISSAPSSIMVELPTLDLECFDGKNHKKRSIVAVIPSFIKGENELIYSATTPMMINIDNAESVTLRSLRCKLVTLDDQPIVLQEGYGCTLTFVISD